MSNLEVTAPNAMSQKKKGIYGSTLKIVAIVTMLIDHIGATIVQYSIQSRQTGLNLTNTQELVNFYATNSTLIIVNTIMRLIGRIAFPIFCFLLVEGFLHTRNVWKYALRLGIFALVSEIPFDLAFSNHFYYPQYQNVYFTLLIGLITLIGFQKLQEKLQDKSWLPVLGVAGAIVMGIAVVISPFGFVQYINNILWALGQDNINPYGSTGILLAIIFSLIALGVFAIMCKKSGVKKASLRFADILILAIGMLAAEYLMTDYSAFGVLTIAVMYGLRKKPFRSMLGGCITLAIMSVSEIPAFLDLILVHKYNGERGLKMKYVFYIFYPAHLLILYGICRLMKII
jgi:hypothetical protein